ncbi:hypothetical protein BX666DRAFT_1858012 [Dichotomocladium elegans]|nr:hypothetical protein BX666DRAFT_1858012 [Dichotomocladium elegans]
MAVILPFLMGNRQLKIELEEPVVYLRGTSTSPRSHLLRGIVVLTLSKPMPVASVDIKFVCKSRTNWPEGIGPHKTKVLHDNVILELQKTLHKVDATATNLIPAGTHKWLFDFVLPYSMVETVQDDTASVYHYLSATVRRPGPSAVNLKRRREILVLRVIQAEGDDENSISSLGFTKQFPCADVTIRLDKAIVVAGTHVLLDITMTPHSKGIWLECISIVFQEYKTYCLPDYNAKRSEVMNAKVSLASATSSTDPNLQDVTLSQLHHAVNAKNAHIPLRTNPFAYQLILKIPTCHLIHHSTTWPELRFRHRIQIRIELAVPDNMDRIIAMFKIPMTVLDCRLKDDDFGLPAYQDAVMDAHASSSSSPAAIASAGHAKSCCPCYVNFQKQLRSNRKKWIMLSQPQQTMLAPPPAYEQMHPPN